MRPLHLTKRLAGLLALLVATMMFALPAQAAPLPQTSSAGRGNSCVPHRHIDNWSNQQSVEARGFNFDLVGDQASAAFGRALALDLASDTTNAEYTASRITEIDTWQPIAERVKCWQATPDKNVVVEFRVRFDQRSTPAGMTETLMLWNAPFPSSTPEPARPVTTIGVSRNSALGAPMYVAVVTQDLDYATFAPPFVFQVMPMPAWLDAADWHRVRITLSQTTAQIDVAQGAHTYATVLKAALLHPAEPLGFELSVDNELAPGITVPVATTDGLDVDYLDIRMERAR
jgi:hypothetical protein